MKLSLAALMLIWPVAASARDLPAPQAAPGPGGWVQVGRANYARADYPDAPILVTPHGVYRQATSPGPRVYRYSNGARVWYGPPAQETFTFQSEPQIITVPVTVQVRRPYHRPW